MPAQYSDSPDAVLAVDTASPKISVAVGSGGRTLASRVAPSGRASPSLLRVIDEVLSECSLEPSDLTGAVGIQGPGSFTGLRVGLATLLGMHRSLDLPATAVPTFVALAWQARKAPGPVLAVVDALRGEWFSQLWDTATALPQPLEEPTIREAGRLAATGAATVVGFGLDALVDGLGDAAPVEAEPLAPSLLEWAASAAPAWDPLPLTEPLYLRPPAATPPKPRSS